MKLLSHLFLAACAAASVDAFFPLNHSSYVNVDIPHSLHHSLLGYIHQWAHFGFLTSSKGSLHLPVYYLPDHGCYGLHNHSGGFPMRPVDPDTGMPEPFPPPFLLMLEEGGKSCSPTRQTRVAQFFGASGLLLTDAACDCAEQEAKQCTPATAETPCHSQLPPLHSAEGGADISIPTVRLKRQEAQAIQQSLVANQPVLATLAWHPKKVTDRVKYGVYASPMVAEDLWEDLREVALAMADHARFEPHPYLVDGTKLNCVVGEGDPESACHDMCTNHGRYCYPSQYRASGKQVVEETLRRACIWKHYGLENGIGEEWFDYVIHHQKHCAHGGNNTFIEEHCVDEALAYAKIDKDTVASCMRDSGGWHDDAPNELLDIALFDQVNHGIVTLPTVRVDHETLHWPAPSARTIFHAICDSYQQQDIPAPCTMCREAPLLIDCLLASDGKKHHHGYPDDDDQDAGKTKKKSRKHHIWSSLLFLSVLGGGAFYVYKKRQEGEGDIGYWRLQEAFMGDT